MIYIKNYSNVLRGLNIYRIKVHDWHLSREELNRVNRVEVF